MRRVGRLAIVIFLTLVLASCSASSTSSSEPTTTSAPTGAPACDRGPAATGTSTFDFGGESHTYRLDLPADGGSAAAPMVLDLHGFGSNGTEQEAHTAMGAKGAARGYVVVTPTSDPPQWNYLSNPTLADDYGYVAALVTDLQRRLCIDPDRTFVAGHSNGSAFAGFLACKTPYLFAGVAMVSATVPSSCPDDVMPAVIAIAGTADPQVPYAGGTVGGSTVAIPAAADTIAAYATKYGCNQSPVTDEPIPGVPRVQYESCRAGTAVVFDTVVGGTHPWPGGSQAVADPTDSEAGKQFDATGAILDFFDQH